MRRMTPAKLLILMDKQMDKLALQEMPIAAFQCMFANANRDPGDEAKGRPAAQPSQVSDFQMFKRRKSGNKSLAAKDKPGGRHTQDGARANRGAWTAWASKHVKPVVRVKKET